MATDASDRSENPAIRAVVVDDSRFMRTVISNILEEGGIQVIGEASDGVEAIDVVKQSNPDVVTMDIEMPRMDGIEAVEEIMQEHPTPICMLSAHTDEGAGVTFEALEKGAVDFFTKPGGEISAGISQHDDQLLKTVRSTAHADLDALPETSSGADSNTRGTVQSEHSYKDNPTVIIGASTGGPNVVEHILGDLPRAAGLRILVVQHMPNEFTARFAERLDRATSYAVREASDGDRIGAGEVLVAKGGYHLEVAAFSRGRLRVKLTEDDAVHGVRPAIDITMETAAETITGPLTAVVLTGMGADGAAGVESVAKAGGHVIAQNEATSTVFGMPKRAIETGVVDDICSLGNLSEHIISSVTQDGDSHE